ncbi:S-layer homology domain-containing protein [Marinicrinis sediminis]|uniref:S-layer homology domain-containing protein n=1 Tax=Marinicrinis sediminis TaxID=1652465 RepID=A0ABW5RAW6_9BACL
MARTIAIPEGVDPDRITTAVIVDEDGTVRHVPTTIIEKDGQFYAQINSLSNSMYTVIYHEVTFEDIAGHWAENAMKDMSARLIVSGYEQHQFKPDQSITRAEFAAMITRALGLGVHEEDSETAYTDVADTAWYKEAIQLATSYGLMSGYEDETFRPDAFITREEGMAVIARAMELTKLNPQPAASDLEAVLSSFEDAGLLSDWSQESIVKVLQAGLVTGRTTNTLDPKADITRAEIAVLIRRLLITSNLIDGTL